jgi:hypothetical protein
MPERAGTIIVDEVCIFLLPEDFYEFTPEIPT